MAIIVDKVQKRKDIALSCSELLLEKGIKKITVAEVAKTAGVAKGSIYDYFKNKEDIVFEVIRNDIVSYQEKLNEKILDSFTTREKVFSLFGFLLEDNEWNERHQNFYKEYMSIDLSGENENMQGFNSECNIFFRNILLGYFEEGIEKGELKKEVLSLIDGIIAVEKGFLIVSWTEKKDIKENLTRFLNTIFDAFEIKQ
jgi:AcrR family transcriptional regulator